MSALDAKAVERIVRRAQAAGQLFPDRDVDGQEATLRVYQAALNSDGVTEAEALDAIVAIAKRTGEDRIAYGRLQPGNLIEAVMEARVRAPAAKQGRCPECEVEPERRGEAVMRGWVFTTIEARGVKHPATRRCSTCSRAA